MAKYSQKSVDYQKDWEEKISRSKKVKADWKKKFHVDMALAYLDGKQNPGYPEEEWITVNRYYSTLKVILPTLYRTDPYFYVKLARTFSPDPMTIALWEQRGKTRQAMLNYMKRELKLKKTARVSIQDSQFAFGVMKTHYTVDQKENPKYGEPIKGEDDNILLDDETGDTLMEPEFIPINKKYHWTRIHFDDFIFDEDAGPLEDTWDWLAQRVVVPLNDAKKDKKFNQKAIKSIEDKGEPQDEDQQNREERKKGSDIAGTAVNDDDSKFFKKENKKNTNLVYWEIYHLKKGTWCCIAEDAEIPLMDEEKLPPGVENHPYSFLMFLPRDDSPYPIPPFSQAIKPQQELNLSRSRMLTHRKRFNRKYTAITTMLEEDTDLSKLESGEDGTVIPVLQHGAIEPIKDAPLDQMTYNEIAMLSRDIDEALGGTTPEARGIAGADSATQAGILDKRLDIREGDDISTVIDFIQDCAKKMDQLVQAHITEDEAVKVTGPEGDYWWLVRTDDYEAIDGEYEYTVNVGSTVPQLPQVERSSWMAFLTILASAPQIGMSKRLLKQTAEMHHIEDDALIDEVFQLMQKMFQVQGAGRPGSQPGVSEANPAGATAGIATGNQSLNLPGAGNLE